MSTLQSSNAAMLFLDGKVLGSFTIRVTKMINIEVRHIGLSLIFSQRKVQQFFHLRIKVCHLVNEIKLTL